ncbi:hypothetical protein GWK47_045204 [Chionoecetes opilio]|uniref:Uncharacterized protein n=1 Tax=Chionoecetes opilio TaxID=41210 RepID=A0A8J5CVA6_CHIOP|nr:hypothetical protein GWK47_045204 [Chionoecetes opilio]
MICCTLSDVEWIGTGSSLPPPQVQNIVHGSWRPIQPHFPPLHARPRCAATSDQLENVLRGVGYTVLHISREGTLVSVISFPPVLHCSKELVDPHSGHVSVSDLVVCSTNALLKRFCIWGKNYTASVLPVDLPVSCAHSFWRGSWSSKRWEL